MKVFNGCLWIGFVLKKQICDQVLKYIGWVLEYAETLGTLGRASDKKTCVNSKQVTKQIRCPEMSVKYIKILTCVSKVQQHFYLAAWVIPTSYGNESSKIWNYFKERSESYGTQ